MRIKKVSQTTATQAQVVNNENNSQLNAYSCNYVNNKVKDVYSTDEVKTNKIWIDGKPIYRKIINTVCDGNATFSINHNISDLEEVTELNYHIFASSTNTTDAFLNSNHGFRVNRITSTVISGISSSGYDNNWQSRITLEYTKTTD